MANVYRCGAVVTFAVAVAAWGVLAILPHLVGVVG